MFSQHNTQRDRDRDRDRGRRNLNYESARYVILFDIAARNVRSRTGLGISLSVRRTRARQVAAASYN